MRHQNVSDPMLNYSYCAPLKRRKKPSWKIPIEHIEAAIKDFECKERESQTAQWRRV